jgi:hypothetical protein
MGGSGSTGKAGDDPSGLPAAVGKEQGHTKPHAGAHQPPEGVELEAGGNLILDEDTTVIQGGEGVLMLPKSERAGYLAVYEARGGLDLDLSRPTQRKGSQPEGEVHVVAVHQNRRSFVYTSNDGRGCDSSHAAGAGMEIDNSRKRRLDEKLVVVTHQVKP